MRAAAAAETSSSSSSSVVTLLKLHKPDLDALVESRVLNPECVRALSAVAERRRAENRRQSGGVEAR